MWTAQVQAPKGASAGGVTADRRASCHGCWRLRWLAESTWPRTHLNPHCCATVARRN